MMVNHDSLIQRDLKHVWHTCAIMKNFEKTPPIIINHAKGSYLYTNQGPLIDAIASWWCKSLGHGHPAIMDAIKTQLTRFEHVIGANTTHPAMVELAEKLAHISGRQHVFFASDGSSAVEIALKLALQATQLKGDTTRNAFISLPNSYHGETLAALSISGLDQYKDPFKALALPCHFLSNIPYVSGPCDPLWQTCEWSQILPELEALKSQACAIIVEPLVQGAAGMRCYSADFLRQLALWAKKNDIYLIADEIMTGLGRTGEWLACHHAGIDADLICLSKGLTSGSMPLSCVLIDHPIFELFYDAPPHQAFLHSHTYSGHPLAICAALATLQTMQNEGINQQANALGQCMLNALTDVATQTGKLTNIRSLGAIVAGDLVGDDPTIGQRLATAACLRGALLRPIGKTLYWLPPLTTDHETIEKLAEITFHSINAV